ncbi:MAG TPA: hypothetical protein ENK91_00520 [Bacteroidetes bacterium]|nr:hypothetical protein [Bacteroidota bacterium]
MKKTINNLFIISLIAITLVSCYEHTEGCRDLNALNFDVVADIDCMDKCCKYPEVNISFNIINDSVGVDSNTTLVNGFLDTFRITELKMYLSDFYLLNEYGDTFAINNSIKEGYYNSGEKVYKDTNYTVSKINLNIHNYNIGSIKKRDTYQQMDFLFGLKPSVNNAILDKVKISNPLSTVENDMYIDSIQGFYFLKLKIEFNDLSSKTFYISGNENSVPISLKSEFNLTERENHYINLSLDVSRWILPMDLRKNNIEVEKYLKNHLSESFFLE